MHDLFSTITGQDQIIDFLTRALRTQNVTHAYLIAGADGCGKDEIALQFAAALLEPESTEGFESVLRHTHPDLHHLEPGGAGGYLVDQIRGAVRDAGLAPIRSNRKVYIIDHAERLQGAPANAFLKTLEEPPGDVTFILLATSEAGVLATLRSRCQVLTCNEMLDEAEGDDQLFDLIHALAGDADNAALLEGARSLIANVSEKLEGLRLSQDEESEAGGEYLSRSAMKSLQENHKRQLASRERVLLLAAVGSIKSWLRDCLLVSEGMPELISYDACRTDTIRVASSCTTAALLAALDATRRAETRISYNVTSQLAIEAMLFEIREALCPQ